MIKKLTVLIYVVTGSILMPVSVRGAAGMPGNFLIEPVGARARGMGGAFTAVADDATAGWFNPAGLSLLAYKEFTAFSRTLWEDTNMTFFSYAYPTKKYGAFGFNTFALNSPGFVQRETIFDEEIEYFDISERVFNFSYSRNFLENYYAGLNFKIISKSVMEARGTGTGFDIGLLYDFEFSGSSFLLNHLNKMRAGLNIQNIIQPVVRMSRDDEGGKVSFAKEKFNTNIAFGLAYKIDNVFTAVRDKLTLSFDIKKPHKIKVMAALGAEYWYKGTLSIRTGISRYFAMGFGVKYRWFQFDFGFDTHPLGTRGQFSFTGRFGIPVKEIKEYSRWRARKDAMNYYKKGLEYYEQGNLSGALSEFEKALIWQPDDEDILKSLEKAGKELEVNVIRKRREKHIGLAYTFYEEGDLVASLEEWKQVVTLDPSNERAFDYIKRIEDGITEREKKEYKERRSKSERQRIISFLGSGDKFYSRKDYLKAVRVWKKILKINPSHSIAIENIKEAEKKIKEVLSSHVKAAKEFYEQKKYTKATIEFKKVVKLEPENNIAEQYLKKIESDIAKVKIKISQKEIDNLYYKSADLYLKGSYKESKKVVEELLEVDPMNKNGYKLLERIESVLTLVE